MSDLVESIKKLRSLDVSKQIEKKGKLSYLSWTYAWDAVLKNCPKATYEVVKQDNGLPYVYDPNTGYMVFTKVTIEGLTHEMWLFVMDGANKAMKAEPYIYKTRFGEKNCEAASMFDINKTIMRCLVKNLAMFGLGLYIYAGEDLPEPLPEKLTDERFKDAMEKLKNKTVTKAIILAFDLTEEQKKQVNK
tara:strand:- start:49 stop:618 length:570 start_codon:yes stop_codon:yes gene_type:complete